MKREWLLLCGTLLSLKGTDAFSAPSPASRDGAAWALASSTIPEKAPRTPDLTITGTITDEKGQGLPGATVVVKGTTIGTGTDTQGKFTLTVPEANAGGTLVVSFVGYTSQEIPISGRTSISVQLRPDAQALSEVVVVGYGTQKREDVTGSVASVPTDRLEKIPISNVAQALQGAVAGVTITAPSSVPGSQPNIQIRGVRSITAGTNPYLVVDGVPFPGNLNDINPNDIASIEILKDASSTAIYGTRGSNGVILVTTKRGKTGKPQIRYNGYGGPEYMVNNLHPLDGPAFSEKWQEFTRQRGINLTPVPNTGELANYEAGKTTDWMDLISQRGSIQNHNASISGGTEDVKYFVSGDYFKQRGIIKGYQFQRISLRTNIDANLTPWLRIGTSAFYSTSNDDGGRASLSLAQVLSPYGTPFNPDGTYTIFPQPPEQLVNNALLGLTTQREDRVNQLTGTGYAEVEPTFLEGLKYRVNGTYSYRPGRFANYAGRPAGDLRGTAQLINDERQNYTVENILFYNKSIGKHNFDLTALYSAQQNRYFTTSETATGFINDRIGFNSIGSGANAPTISSFNERRTLVSQMGRLNYNYDSRYLLTVTARRDGSSVFGADADKYAVFPSIALGWNIANEAFLKDQAAVNLLKLRFSYGTTGNEGINPYQTITGNALLQYAYGGVAATGLRADRIGNTRLKWEQTTSSNYAVDFGVLKNRITGTVEYYNAETEDLLLNRQIPIISGYGTILDNVGSVRNRGIEMSLTTANVQTPDFTWETTLNASGNRNKLLSLGYTDADDIGNRLFIGRSLGAVYDYVKTGVWQVGEDPAGLDPTAKPGDLKFEDLNGDGQITTLDRKYLGSTLPKWQGGITNTFTYKGISLRVFIQTVQGVLKNNNNLNFLDLGGRLNVPREVGYWTPQNQSQDRPGLSYINPRGYGFPTNGSFTRLKDLTLNYAFPAPLLDKLRLGTLSVYVSGRNLYTWTDWVGWDPEQTYTLGNGTGNIDNPVSLLTSSTNFSPTTSVNSGTAGQNPNFPTVRSFVFGLNIGLR
ncbi:SusC/RagA family TonB-linked outer membrane protein [Hymenobacter sp. HDW8]|uniref:SusC/RagA family TonB-linked outer membrane protein n=1 Tax=Hymenobacter sp. HDW8 TaxID=2714932 RepID=UPI00140C3CFA|nr:TonB-dependent receptor [Hymenobacter sp. HDW8]QIL74686.1 TonB-dependent receptor [Hymenobacter sp. HDW8]